MSAVLHLDRMCAMVPLPPHSLHSGCSLMPHSCKCVVSFERVVHCSQQEGDVEEGDPIYKDLKHMYPEYLNIA